MGSTGRERPHTRAPKHDIDDIQVNELHPLMQNPITLISRALGLWVKGRVRFEHSLQGEHLEDRDERFTPFRKVIVKPLPGEPPVPGATFRIRFRFKSFSARVNRLLSLIPIPLILAQPGFRSKTWMLGEETGDFLGYYEFDTLQAAEAYWNSLPLRMMRQRAAPGSLTHEVRPLDKV